MSHTLAMLPIARSPKRSHAWSGQATASFGVAPLLLWQVATRHFTNISVETAGNRDAKGMQIKLTIQNVRLKNTPNSRGTIGA